MVSEEYEKSISNIIRETKAEIKFDFTDTTASKDCTPTIPKQAPFSKENNLLNNKKDKSVKIATLEKGFWKLDGTFITQGEQDLNNEEVGFISDVVSNENGVFETPVLITFNFKTQHSSIGLTLYFDNLTNNYVKKMRIVFYRDSEVLTDETVENNGVEFVYSNRVENYNKIEVYFLETSLPYRRARLVDIIFGIVQIYKDKEIVNCTLTREFNVYSDNIPSHELSFEIDNLARDFNLINPNGFYAYLQKRQSASVKMGVVLENGTTEFVDMGIYYLNEWSTQNLTATLKAQDILSFLDEIKYSNLEEQTKSLKDFAIEILNFAGIKNYILDDSLASVFATTKIEENTVKKLLQQISIAGNCVLYVDKENRINIVKLNITKSNNIELKNMYNPPEISLEELVNRVKVTYHTGDETNEVALSTDETDGKEKTIDSIFITSLDTANKVANYLLNLYQQRLKYKVNWRQNPDIDINQKVKIEDDFNENNDVLIIKQEFKYAGYLNGNTEGRVV